MLPLNTARGWQTRTDWAEGSVNLGQLDDVLSQAGEADTIPVMVCHHPLTPFQGAGLETRTRRGETASDLLAESPLRLLMTGQVHTPHAEQISSGSGSYLAVSAGTLALRLRSSPPGFNVIDVESNGLTVSPLHLQEDAFVPLPSWTFAWTGAADRQASQGLLRASVHAPPERRTSH